MYPRRTLIAAGLLAFLAGLLTLMPVHFLLGKVPGLASRVSLATGTLWRGSARLSLPRGAVQVSWDSHPLHLLWLSAAADWTLSGDDFRAEGTASLAPWGRHLRIAQGQVGPETLGRIIGSQGQIDQPLLVQGVDVDFGRQGRVEQAAGRLAWGPGQVHLPSRPEPLGIPALHGTVQAVAGRLQILVDGEQQPKVATVDIDPAANELHLVVTREGGALFGIPPSPGNSGSALLELRQPLH